MKTSSEKKRYYPRELLQMIEELPNFEKEFNIEVGEIYTVRAFFWLCGRYILFQNQDSTSKGSDTLK
jgi:hypothetical protein